MLDNPSGVFGTGRGGQSVEDEDVMVIAASGLFDEDWYIRQNPDVARSGINPLLHYVRHGASENRTPFPGFNATRYIANAEGRAPVRRNPLAHYILNGCSPDDLLSKGLLRTFSVRALKAAMARLNALPLFSPEDYLKLNEDVRPNGGIDDVPPDNHALVSGFPAGRKVFLETTVARVMGAAAKKPFAPVAAPVLAQLPKLPPVGVFFNAAGNAFLREIAEDIAAGLAACGQDVVVLDDLSDIEARPKLCLFVAPHEFFHIGNGPAWAREEILKDAILFTTEQPQTVWFERSMPYVLMARAIIDISWQVHDILGQAGIPALHFNPPAVAPTRYLRDEDMDHPLLRTLPTRLRGPEIPFVPFAEREIDISFFGSASEHREKFFAKNAWFLARYDAFLYYRKVESPLAPKGTHAALGRLAGHVTAHSKISLNIHRDPNGFFEWHRIAKIGIGGGAVVVSEPCDPHPLYQPGVHYLEESGRHILDLMEWLIGTPDGQAQATKIQANGQALLADAGRAEAGRQALVRFLHQHMVPG